MGHLRVSLFQVPTCSVVLVLLLKTKILTTVSQISDTRNNVPAGHVGLLLDDGEAVVVDV